MVHLQYSTATYDVVVESAAVAGKPFFGTMAIAFDLSSAPEMIVLMVMFAANTMWLWLLGGAPSAAETVCQLETEALCHTFP